MKVNLTRLAFILLWGMSFCFGLGALLVTAVSYGYEVTTGSRLVPSFSVLVLAGAASLLLGICGLALGFLGILPGTKRNSA
ncbi:MAG TPA: hypothetical protein VFL42_05620 [Terriglobales bacterium]|nr:hypothetical protein [Terriglobales bacterium]